LDSLDESDIRPVNPLIPGDEIGVAEIEFAKMLIVLSLSITNNP